MAQHCYLQAYAQKKLLLYKNKPITASFTIAKEAESQMSTGKDINWDYLFNEQYLAIEGKLCFNMDEP